MPQFLNQYGTEAQCHSALFGWHWSDGFICPDSGHSGYFKIAGRGLYQCYRFHHQTSVTSGTIFEYTKLPLTIWFLGMYLLTQPKNGISVLELKQQLGIGFNAAWRMKHKFLQVMKERDDSKTLSGNIQLDDAYWGGEHRGGKRRCGAPGKTPFVAAAQTNEEGHPISMRFTKLKGFSKDAIMLPLPTGRGAKKGESALPYVRHRPEQTFLYQLIEKYYPVFEEQCVVEDRILPDYVRQESEDYL